MPPVVPPNARPHLHPHPHRTGANFWSSTRTWIRGILPIENNKSPRSRDSWRRHCGPSKTVLSPATRAVSMIGAPPPCYHPGVSSYCSLAQTKAGIHNSGPGTIGPKPRSWSWGTSTSRPAPTNTEACSRVPVVTGSIVSLPTAKATTAITTTTPKSIRTPFEIRWSNIRRIADASITSLGFRVWWTTTGTMGRATIAPPKTESIVTAHDVHGAEGKGKDHRDLASFSP
mmetsp:Transcript_21576/g.59973  ORF Transcript_21576/g.59973 Transcript_21576/m.59973 type:complete len:229 (-) Transcript_21576:944-1630(-)